MKILSIGGLGLKNRHGLIFAFVVFNLIFLCVIIMNMFYGPAFYVVGGDSMEQKKSPQMGFIDFKDGIIVRPLENDEDVITYYEGKRLGHMTFGDYGDVVAFQTKDISHPISHRAICFVRYNLTGPNVTVDIPELGLFGISDVTFEGVGLRNDSFYIDFLEMYEDLLQAGDVEKEGFITKGDNRNYADQDGMGLVGNDSILGKVEVVDNELVARSPYEYIFIIIILITIVLSYLSDIMLGGGDIGLKKLIKFQKVPVLVLFIYIFCKDIFIIVSTEGFGIDKEINYVLYAILMATVPVIIGYASSKVLNGEERKTRKLVPIIIIGAFLLYFFIMTFLIHLFFYSLVAYSFAVSLIYLRPMLYFQNSSINEKEISGWILLFGIEIFMLILIINMSLPFYSFLIIGMIFTNFFSISLGWD